MKSKTLWFLVLTFFIVLGLIYRSDDALDYRITILGSIEFLDAPLEDGGVALFTLQPDEICLSNELKGSEYRKVYAYQAVKCRGKKGFLIRGDEYSVVKISE